MPPWRSQADVPKADGANLTAALRAAGFRVTKARAAICEALAVSHDDHLTPSALHRRAEAIAGWRIDPSTVYRTLDALEEAGVVDHVHLGHGAAVIHLAGHRPHQHLVCEECGRTTDLPLEELAGLADEVARKHDFVIDSVHFAVVGRCAGHVRNES